MTLAVRFDLRVRPLSARLFLGSLNELSGLFGPRLRYLEEAAALLRKPKTEVPLGWLEVKTVVSTEKHLAIQHQENSEHRV